MPKEFTLADRLAMKTHPTIVASDKSLNYSDDLQAPELNGGLSPILARLASEGYVPAHLYLSRKRARQTLFEECLELGQARRIQAGEE
jgi:hypothetical protein